MNIASNESVLLLGNYRPTLPLARLFALRGYAVIGGTLGPEPFFKYSHFISHQWEHPDAKLEPEQFFKELSLYCDTHPGLVAIFPVVEDYVRLFAEHPQWLVKLPSVIMVEPSLIIKCLDKISMMNLAERCSIPIAPFAEAQNRSELYAVVENIGFPVVVRPAVATNALNGKKAVMINSKFELDHFDTDWQKHSRGLILQRRFKGIRHNIYFAAFEGQICRYLHAEITRTNCLDGSGLALEGKTVEPDSNLRDQSEKLIEEMNYSGIGCIQYLVNGDTGESSFLEINPRVAGNGVVPEFAGLHLIDFITDLVLTGKPDLEPCTGQGGIRYAWSSADIIAAKAAWRKGEISLLKSIAWLVKAVVLGLRADVHILFSWRDPKPSLFALAESIPGVNRLIEKRCSRPLANNNTRDDECHAHQAGPCGGLPGQEDPA